MVVIIGVNVGLPILRNVIRERIILRETMEKRVITGRMRVM